MPWTTQKVCGWRKRAGTWGYVFIGVKSDGWAYGFSDSLFIDKFKTEWEVKHKKGKTSSQRVSYLSQSEISKTKETSGVWWPGSLPSRVAGNLFFSIWLSL